jgi:hypothetical protein
MTGYLLLQLGYHPVAVVKYRKETAQNEKQYTKQYKNNTKSQKNYGTDNNNTKHKTNIKEYYKT